MNVGFCSTRCSAEPCSNENMKTDFPIVNGILFVSSLELTLPAFFQISHNFLKTCSPKFVVAFFIWYVISNFHFFLLQLKK